MSNQKGMLQSCIDHQWSCQVGWACSTYSQGSSLCYSLCFWEVSISSVILTRQICSNIIPMSLNHCWHGEEANQSGGEFKIPQSIQSFLSAVIFCYVEEFWAQWLDVCSWNAPQESLSVDLKVFMCTNFLMWLLIFRADGLTGRVSCQSGPWKCSNCDSLLRLWETVMGLPEPRAPRITPVTLLPKQFHWRLPASHTVQEALQKSYFCLKSVPLAVFFFF